MIKKSIPSMTELYYGGIMMNDKFYVGIESIGHKIKPANIPSVKNDAMRHYNWDTLDTIADLVGNKGHAIMPEYLKGGMKQENFRSMQLFFLDFDGKKTDNESGRTIGQDITFAEVKSRAEEYDLQIAFAYWLRP